MKKNKIITEMCQKALAFKTDGGNITTIVEIPLDNTTKKFAINNQTSVDNKITKTFIQLGFNPSGKPLPTNTEYIFEISNRNKTICQLPNEYFQLPNIIANGNQTHIELDEEISTQNSSLTFKDTPQANTAISFIIVYQNK